MMQFKREDNNKIYDIIKMRLMIMLNTLEQFRAAFPEAVIVNYDIANVHGYGLSYRTSSERVEIFRKDNGKYLEYPNIQLYSNLKSDNYKIFIIKNNKIFELGVGDKPNCFKIEKELKNVDINIFDRIFYVSKKYHKKSANRKDEPIFTIE